MLTIIETVREAYGFTDVMGDTMTAGQLAEFFAELDPESPVILSFDDGYTYGKINLDRIHEEDWEDEEDEDKYRREERAR